MSSDQWTETCSMQSELCKLYPHLHLHRSIRTVLFRLIRTVQFGNIINMIWTKWELRVGEFFMKSEIFVSLEHDLSCYLNLHLLGCSSYCSNKYFYFFYDPKLILVDKGIKIYQIS